MPRSLSLAKETIPPARALALALARDLVPLAGTYPLDPTAGVPAGPDPELRPAVRPLLSEPVQPQLSGRYEVVIPTSESVLFFADSLAAVAEHVAISRWASLAKAGDVLAFLENVQRLGFLGVGTQGVRLHRNYSDGRIWIARVRGTQARPAARYRVGEVVEATDACGPLPNHLWTGKAARVFNVFAREDRREGLQYAYTLGGGNGVRILENRLRPLSFQPDELDFGSQSA